MHFVSIMFQFRFLLSMLLNEVAVIGDLTSAKGLQFYQIPSIRKTHVI